MAAYKMDVLDAAGASLGYHSLKDDQIKALCTFVGGRDVPCRLAMERVYCFSRWGLTTCTRYIADDHKKSIVVVVSPLIALMEDQVASYSAKGGNQECVCR